MSLTRYTSLGALVLGAVFALGEPPRPALTADALLRAVKAQGFVERLEKFSEKFLGTPYEVSPLGEGPGARVDQGPLLRLDAFDCTTLVETVIALALSGNTRELETWLRRIRYRGGEVSFLTRNHFACGDWVPSNKALGVLTDITIDLAGPMGTREAFAEETKRGWIAHLPKEVVRLPGATSEERDLRYSELQKEAAKIPARKVSLSYLPLDKLLTRKPVSEVEQKRRAAEETALAEQLRTTQGTVGSIDAKKLEADIHNAIVDLRLKYLTQETEVDARFLAQIPSGTLVNVVRPNYRVEGTPLLISHQGLVVRKGDAPYFRHVSRSGGGRTKDVLLANYLRLCLLSPQIHGIQLLRINDLRRPIAAKPR